MATVATTTQVHAHPIDPEDAGLFAAAGIQSLLALVPPSERDADTPARVVRAFVEMTRGYAERPERILAQTIPARSDDLVIVKDIAFTSLCRHHLMPFSGVAHVGYIPVGVYTGLSKIARLVDCFARRLQIQEQLAADIAEAITRHLTDAGVAVVIEASHGCLSCRGAQKREATFVTSSMLGRFRYNPALRAEFFALTRSRV